jgi:plastocyanin
MRKLLALAVGLALALAAAGAAADSPTAEVLIPGRQYVPADLQVLVGTTVTWRNGDVSTHTVTADDFSFDSGDIPPGGTFARTFDRPGLYKLHCTIHRSMHGLVRVYALVLVGPAHPLRAGTDATVSGLAPADATEVVLQRRAAGRWQQVARKPPLPGGTFNFAFRATAPGAFRAVAGGAASPVVSVHVAPTVRARLVGGLIEATTTPPRPGDRAVLQAYDREHFTFFPVARHAVGRSGAVRFALPAGPPRYLRVVVRGRGGWSDGTSQVLLVRPAAG